MLGARTSAHHRYVLYRRYVIKPLQSLAGAEQQAAAVPAPHSDSAALLSERKHDSSGGDQPVGDVARQPAHDGSAQAAHDGSAQAAQELQREPAAEPAIFEAQHRKHTEELEALARAHEQQLSEAAARSELTPPPPMVA